PASRPAARANGAGRIPAASAPAAAAARPAAPAPEFSVQREVYGYEPAGRRDPFLSLMNSSELRPMMSDLRLAVVVFDPNGGSRAVLRDVNTKEQYKVRIGQTLGRMRVARIAPRSVTFTILEFGESRQETLALNDSTLKRTP
ncbi:MAG: hypothetical protein WKG32_16945, partial [Gemmatimonadaceae bacterium]